MSLESEIATNPRVAIGGNFPPEPTLQERVDGLDGVLADTHASLMNETDAIARRANLFLPKSEANPNGGRTIKGAADVEMAKEIILDAKSLAAKLEAKRKDEKKPWYDGGKKVDAFFSARNDRLDRISRYLDSGIRTLQDELEAKARAERAAEAQRKQQEAERQAEIARKAEEDGRLAAAAKAHQKAENAAVESEALKAGAARADEVRTSGVEFAGMSVRKEWNFEIVDRSKIDLNKLSPWISLADVEKALRGYVRANKGTAPLEGVRIFESSGNTYRR